MNGNEILKIETALIAGVFGVGYHWESKYSYSNANFKLRVEMFIAVYEFKIKPGKEKDFQSAWAKLTGAIARHRGGLGSRLHRTEQNGIYVAYAEWPSRERYLDESGNDKFSAEENQEREKMKAATEYMKTVYLMEVVEDLLK